MQALTFADASQELRAMTNDLILVRTMMYCSGARNRLYSTSTHAPSFFPSPPAFQAPLGSHRWHLLAQLSYEIPYDKA